MEEVNIVNSSCQEIPKIKRLFYVWFENITDVSKFKRLGEWRISQIALSTGISFKEFQIDVTEWSLDESGKKSLQGSAFQKEISGFMPKFNEFAESYFNEMTRRPMAIAYETFDGNTYLFGGTNYKTSFSFRKSISGRQGYDVYFNNTSDESSLIINDTDHFPAPSNLVNQTILQVNGDDFTTIPCGNTFDLPVKNSLGVEVGSKVGSEWIVPASNFNIGLVDRFGNNFGTKTVSANANWDLRTLTPYNYADILLSKETDWSVSGAYSDTDARNAVIDLVDDLHAAGLWELMFGVYPLIGGSASKHKWNLRYPFDNDNSLRLSFFNSPTHDGEGIKCSGLGTNFFSVAISDNPSNLAIHNFGHFSVYYRAYTAISNNSDLRALGDSRQIWWHLNDPTAGSGTLRMAWCSPVHQVNPSSALTLTGHWCLNRPNSTNLRQVRNGVLERSVSNTSGDSYPDSSGWVYSNFRWGGGTKTMSSFTLGKGLTTTQEADLYTIIQAFQTTLGRNL